MEEQALVPLPLGVSGCVILLPDWRRVASVEAVPPSSGSVVALVAVTPIIIPETACRRACGPASCLPRRGPRGPRRRTSLVPQKWGSWALRLSSLPPPLLTLQGGLVG